MNPDYFELYKLTGANAKKNSWDFSTTLLSGNMQGIGGRSRIIPIFM